MPGLGGITAVWPEGQHYLQSIITVGYLICVCLLSVMIAKRMPALRHLRHASVVKLLVLAVLCDSFLFIWTSAVLVLGVGTSLSEAACQVGIWWCAISYASSKVLIYLFLMERVHLVFSHSVSRRVSRVQSPWYRASCFFFACWIGVAVVMCIGRISYIREHDEACIIGLKLYASVPMLATDFAVNVFLTGAFVWSLRGAKFSKARRLAAKSTIAATAALVTSFANICLLTIQHGKQLSWVCLGSCGLDVVFNAVIIFIITSGDSSDDDTTFKSQNRRPSLVPIGGFSTNSMSGITVHQECVTKDERDLYRPGPFPSPRRANPSYHSVYNGGQAVNVNLKEGKIPEMAGVTEATVAEMSPLSPDFQVEMDRHSENSTDRQYFV